MLRWQSLGKEQIFMEHLEFRFCYLMFEIPVRYSNKDVRFAIGNINLRFLDPGLKIQMLEVSTYSWYFKPWK